MRYLASAVNQRRLAYVFARRIHYQLGIGGELAPVSGDRILPYSEVSLKVDHHERTVIFAIAEVGYTLEYHTIARRSEGQLQPVLASGSPRDRFRDEATWGSSIRGYSTAEQFFFATSARLADGGSLSHPSDTLETRERAEGKRCSCLTATWSPARAT